VSVTDDDDALATDACVVSPASSAPVTVSVTTQYVSGLQGSPAQMHKQEMPTEKMQRALSTVIEIARREPRPVTWMEL